MNLPMFMQIYASARLRLAQQINKRRVVRGYLLINI